MSIILILAIYLAEETIPPRRWKVKVYLTDWLKVSGSWYKEVFLVMIL
jgi:hypothetical protein